MRKRLKPQEAELLGFEPKENLPDRNAKYSINTKEWEKILDFRINQNKTKPIEESPNDELTKHKPFILSAWNNTNGKILDINEYCTVHNLPRQDVRSYKLITHTAIPYYNIQFRENVSEVDALQDLFTDEYFKEIAGKTFFFFFQNIEQELLVDNKVDLSKMIEPAVKIAVTRNQMPKVTGLIGKNIIPQLENQGYRVDYKGVGRIKEQFPVEGTIINKNQRIYLQLQY